MGYKSTTEKVFANQHYNSNGTQFIAISHSLLIHIIKLKKPMSESSSSAGASPARPRRKSDLDERQIPTDLDGQPKVPAWQLREENKFQNRPSTNIPKVPKMPRRISPGIDPALPPAFREMHIRNRQKQIDDFMSLDSVHSSKTQMSSQTSLMTGTTTQSDSDSDSDLDSFASLEEDDDDDEAYREGRNQMARQTLDNSPVKGRNRLKRFNLGMNKGVHGAPLDFIAE